MKLKELIFELRRIAINHPEMKDLPVYIDMDGCHEPVTSEMIDYSPIGVCIKINFINIQDDR